MMTLVLKRLLWAGPTLLAISVISLVILQLPAGDYLAGAMVMLLAMMAVLSTLISDLLLMALAPPIRYQAKARA